MELQSIENCKRNLNKFDVTPKVRCMQIFQPKKKKRERDLVKEWDN